MQKSIRVIGIDPGYAIVGYGILDYQGGRFRTLDYGAITTEADMPFSRRLEHIHDRLSEILDAAKPDAMSVEKLFFTSNQKTAIDVAQARGVIQLCGVKRNIEIVEYTPLQVKMAVVGYGKADKNQMQQMTKTILGLSAVPKPDDTADALAIAICHAHTSGSVVNYAHFNSK